MISQTAVANEYKELTEYLTEMYEKFSISKISICVPSTYLSTVMCFIGYEKMQWNITDIHKINFKTLKDGAMEHVALRHESNVP